MSIQKEDQYNSVVFVSFESQYAPCGGLSAVMKMLPPIMSKSIKTILIAPLFFNIEKTKKAIESKKLIKTEHTGKVLYKGFSHTIHVYKSTEFSEYDQFDILLVQCEKFFCSAEDPYIDTWRPNSLIHDSYFLSKSVPIILNLIKEKYEPPYIINLQDWETALVAETMPYTIQNDCFLTIHNPYDEYLPLDPQGRTVLQLMIPKMKGISTVSEHFAHELQNDVLVKEVLSNKLQSLFQEYNPIGINNGNFIKLSFPEHLVKPDEIIQEKLNNRKSFNQLLNEKKDLNPKWGNKIDLMKDNKAIFLLFGRDEPVQKGFDVAAAAIYNLLKKGEFTAYFILSPIPGPYGLNNLAYMEDLCYEFSENIMVFPSRMSRGYEELQRAANYIIMPSYYEPFGAANEGYGSGVPVIARATGGLVQQICPKNFDSLPKLTQEYVKIYHNGVSKYTGYLYRENPSTETKKGWEYLRGSDFSKKRSIQEPIDWRNPIFWSMVSELEKVLEDAILFYENDKKAYCDMILNGITLFKEFTWEKSAENYRKMLYKIK